VINYAIFIAALIQVESGGNDGAVGDGGQAIGCLQLHPEVVEDVNRVYKTCFTPNDRFRRDRSITIAQLWLMHQETAYRKRTGKRANEETCARIFTRGLAGHLAEPWEAEGYWRKVSAEMGEVVAP